MTAAEFEEAIFRLLRREPFHPFDVELSDGQKLHIDSAEAVCTSGTAAVVWPEPEGLIKFDHTNTVRMGSEAKAPA
jgi:hypothetical protein